MICFVSAYLIEDLELVLDFFNVHHLINLFLKIQLVD